MNPYRRLDALERRLGPPAAIVAAWERRAAMLSDADLDALLDAAAACDRGNAALAQWALWRSHLATLPAGPGPYAHLSGEALDAAIRRVEERDAG